MIIRIAAEDVRPGDRLYNKYSTQKLYRWVSVTRVESRLVDKLIIITTAIWQTHKHPKEGIAVERFDDPQ